MFYQFKVILRNLRRNGLYSFINVLGLAISLSACIFIALWASDEMSYDRFHRNASNIYRVNQKMFDRFSSVALEAVASAAAAEIPEVVKTCRVGYYYGANSWEYDSQFFYPSAFYGATVDTSFFTLFDFKIVKGNPVNPFTDHLSMVISETKAKIIFGEDDPIGKPIKSSHGKLFHITGVMQDMPKNTCFSRYDFLVPFVAMQLDYHRAEIGTLNVENWRGNITETYFQITPGVDVASVTDKISRLATDRTGKETTFFLQPLAKLHLFNADGQPAGMKAVRFFCAIAILILSIACINYVNLVTARATKRNKEVSVKKILGGKRKRLIGQLTGEAFVLFLVALSFSTLIINLLFPLFNQIAGKEMVFNLFSTPVLLIYGMMTVIVILLAGLYPAIHLSSFKPLDVFHGGGTGQGKHRYLRQSLVVVQYVFSFGLIVATIVIASQLNYMRKKDLGYDNKNVFTFEAKNLYSHYEAVKNELSKNPNIIGVSGMAPGGREISNWDGKELNNNPRISTEQICFDFFYLMNIQLASGEYLSETDDKQVLVNEEAVRVMGIDNPVGKRIWNDTDSRADYIIKGVVKDYHFYNLKTPIQPMMLSLTKYPFNLYVKTVEGGTQNALASVEKLWKAYNPNSEFRYRFLEDDFDRMYKADMRIGNLLFIFAFIAIFVSCLGLFGLVTFIAETKTKEIGIRKVFGANVKNIVSLLSKDFFILVGIAMLIAFPLAHYFLDLMLQEYAYRIRMSWWMFATAGAITLVLTLLTVGFQAYIAATSNPVEAIMNCE